MNSKLLYDIAELELRCWPTLSCPARVTQVGKFNINPTFDFFYFCEYIRSKYITGATLYFRYFVSKLLCIKFFYYIKTNSSNLLAITGNNTSHNASALCTPTDAVQGYSHIKNLSQINSVLTAWENMSLMFYTEIFILLCWSSEYILFVFLIALFCRSLGWYFWM